MPYNPYAYQMPTYYGQPMPDNLTQLRQGVGYQSPMMQQPTAQTAQATPSIIWVQGEEGAKAYMVAAGNSVLLMDSENSAFTSRAPMPAGCRCLFASLTTRNAPRRQKCHLRRRSSPEGSLLPEQSLTLWQPAVRRWKSKSPQNLKWRLSNYGKPSF